MKQAYDLVLLTALALLSIGVHSATLLGVGDPFPEFQARDQHDLDYRFEPGTRTVLIAFGMAAAKKANRILAEQGAGFLEQHSAVYISNIHGMPGVGRMFALPKMKKYPHRVILADEENLLSPFPRQEGRITVIQLDASGVVRSVLFWNPEEAPVQDYLQ